MRGKKEKVLVVVPTYNEAANIKELIKQLFELPKKHPALELDVLVVDDNSPDGTGQLVKLLQAKNKKLHLISAPKAGLGKAYIRGFKRGFKLGDFEVFIMMDADFSHDPKAIPSLLAPIRQGADYVSGSRYITGGSISGNWPKMRSFNSRAANLFARLFIGDKHNETTDFTGGFKALRASALRQIDLDHMRASGYVFIVNLLHEFSKRGFKIKEVPIAFTNRQLGRSKLRLADILEFLYLTYRLNPESRVRRMIRFCLVGATGTIVNLLAIVFLVRAVHLHVLLADALAIEISIISNFFMNHFYTFKATYTAPKPQLQDSWSLILRKLGKFNLITLGGAAISFLFFLLTNQFLGWHYVLADLTAIIVAMSWNYWMSVNVVWKVVDAPLEQ